MLQATRIPPLLSRSLSATSFRSTVMETPLKQLCGAADVGRVPGLISRLGLTKMQAAREASAGRQAVVG